MRGHCAAALGAAWLLAACGSAPVAPAPAAAIGALPALQASRTATTVPGLAIDRWWTLFGDPTLDALVARALERNHDLTVAAARVREARARLDEAGAAGSPALDAQAQTARSRRSGDGALPSGAALTRSNHQAALVAQYDVDLWGRLASSQEAARQRLLAQEWTRASIEWSLTAQLAEAHFSLAAVRQQLRIGDAVRASRAHTLALRRQELAAGAASEFDVRRAEAELASADATLVALQRQRVALEGTLALLSGLPLAEVGRMAGAVEPAAADTAPAFDPTRRFEARLPRGETRELLVRRPDLREAEVQLATAQHDIAAARAATLPALRLSGSVGSDVASLANLFNAPGFVWSIVAGLTQSLADGGANRARLEQAEARREAALAQYRRAVLAALLELREAYAALDLAERAQQAQAERVAAFERTRSLARIGVGAGALSQIDLLDAERNAFQAQLDAVNATRDRLLGQVAVMRALGGGHSPAPA
jgi:multidrug efflux system outer membrane protein